MTRAVAEWVGATDDAAVPERVQLRIWRSQLDADGVARCHISGEPMHVGDDKQLDHKVPLILLGQHRESNLAWCLTRFHRQKTAQEVAIRAGNDARAKAHAGIKTTERTGLEGRDRHQKQAARDRKTADAGKLALPPRRGLYADAPRQAAPLQITGPRR